MSEIYSSPAPGQHIALKFGKHKFNLRLTGDTVWWTCKIDAPGSLDLCFVTAASLKPVIARLEAAAFQSWLAHVILGKIRPWQPATGGVRRLAGNLAHVARPTAEVEFSG